MASLFDLVIVGARKPEFFSGRGPLFRVVDERGLLEPCVAGPTGPGVYLGGHAEMVEDYLGVSGAEILYVGDHLYTDVRVSKDIRRWRTGLIVRELEDELAEREARRDDQTHLDRLMAEKTPLEYEQAQWRLRAAAARARVRARTGRDPRCRRGAARAAAFDGSRSSTRRWARWRSRWGACRTASGAP